MTNANNTEMAKFTAIAAYKFLRNGYQTAHIEAYENTAGMVAAGSGLRFQEAGFEIRVFRFDGSMGTSHFVSMEDAINKARAVAEFFFSTGGVMVSTGGVMVEAKS